VQHFNSEAHLKRHYQLAHAYEYCATCEIRFADNDDLWSHFETNHHACRVCYKVSNKFLRIHPGYVALVLRDNVQMFNTRDGLREHDRDAHTYCTDCRRSFQNQNNLNQHLLSNLHKPSTLICPGRGCNRSFSSPARLVLHFESGTCPSGMTREELNRLVVRADRNNVITNSSRLLCGPSGCEPPATAKLWATSRSYNGEAYECFLCHATYRTLAGLNQHLQSPRHESRIYRCPKSDCGNEFVALSALCQHVEGGSCGVRMFREVRNVMDSLTRGFTAITI
jgi:Zinc-finger double-stranded RNA-binding/Zinc-finger of C2H2 type